MRRVLVAGSVLGALLLAASAARADDTDLDGTSGVPPELDRLVLDTGRRVVPPTAPETFRFLLHGELQLRYQAEKSFALDPTATQVAAHPGLIGDSLGQNQVVTHWLRASPRLQIEDHLELIGQFDIVSGVLLGELAHDTRADLTPRDDYNGFGNFQPRWLYARYKLPFGTVSIGQQPNHWGLGLVANDGDHPSLFGDYRYGSISERILFGLKPGGRTSDFVLAVAGDLVYRDAHARLTRGQQAFQGVLAAFYEHGHDKLGVYSTFRHQTNDETSGSDVNAYHDTLDALTVDLDARHAAQVPGVDAFVFAEVEAAYVAGSTDLLRTTGQALSGSKTAIRSYGGAAIVGVAHRHAGSPTATAKGVPFGDVVGQLEIGYASGDADPDDATERRFTFDPNRKVGLLLFDEILRFQTARAATAATDAHLTNAGRPSSGNQLVPSQGGVFGAEYVNPTFVYRPRSNVDLKAGMVVAQATSEVVDPYRLITQGSYVNYRGGDRRKKDLGIEFDAGIEGRFPLQYDLEGVLGAQAGLLFPGSAFEDANGDRMPPQWIVITRLGLQF